MKILNPYSHDCSNCVYIGWIHIKGGGKFGSDWGNMYYCPCALPGEHGSVIIRFSDEPSDYWSKPIGCVKGPLQLSD